jgi:hypothetical protein
MPTLMQKIRLVIRGWNRRRQESEKEFLARNANWSGGQAPSPVRTSQPGTPSLQLDIEGLTVAYLDDSGRITYYLDVQTGDVVDVRDNAQLDSKRYRRVPSRTSASDVDDRRAFISDLEDSSARVRLNSAAPETFRDALAADRGVERAWYNFRNDRAIAAIQRWLSEIGLR